MKNNMRTQQTLNSFDEFYRKCSQDSPLDKKEDKSLCIVFTK